MVVDWASALIKVAPSAGQLAARGIRGFALTWRVAFSTRRQAKKQELGVLPYWKLRKYLSTGEALLAFGSGESERYHEVGRHVVALYDSPPAEHADAERQIVALLLCNYTKALDPNSNTALYSGVTAERVTAKIDERDAQRYIGETTFEQNLQHIPPHRAAEARDLTVSWPPVTRFVQEFVNSPDRSAALTSWYNSPPTWFQTRPSAAVAWFARIANDYGLREIASAAFNDAIDAGATPEAYWRTRQILLQSEDLGELASLLEQYANGDPIAGAIVTANTAGYAAAANVLREWEPQTAVDRSAKSALLSQLVAPDDLAEAIALSQQGFTDYQSTSCGSLSAQFMLLRGQSRKTALDFADLERALESALKARDAIRVWEGPSSRPVELAIVACRLLGRVQQAWSLARPAPEGSATSSEAAADGVRKEAATIAAQVKSRELARELAFGTDPLTLHEVEALIALFEGDDDTALAEFQSATECAVELQDIQRLAFHMAQLGVRSPKVSQLTASQQEEIGLVADAQTGSEEALSILRTRSRANRALCRVLIGFSLERGKPREAALQTEQFGKDWADPELELFAAEQYLELEDYDSAVRCAEEALRLASPAWENWLRAYNVVIQAQTVRGRWVPAARAAMEVLAKEPESASAVWVLTLCQYHLGQLEQAWRTYSNVGHRPEPRNEREAVIRIDLWRRFEPDASSLVTLTALRERFPESREVKAAVVNALLFLPLSEDDLETIDHVRSIIEPLFAELPDVFVEREIDQVNPLASFNDLIAERPDTSDQDVQIERGHYPLGLAATLHRKSLTEVLAIRTRAPVFSGAPDLFEIEVQNALGATGSRVIIDLTALYLLSLLDESLSDQLLGCFLQPEVSRAQLIDSIQGSDSLARLSTLHIGRAPDGSAFPVTISMEEAEARHRRAQRIRSQFEKAAQNDRVGIQHFPEMVPDDSDAQFTWLAAADNAIDSGYPLWCDDRVTRLLVAAKDGLTFGTQALLEALRRNGTITDQTATAYQALLVTHYFVGLHFRSDWLTHAANLDGWKPRGIASFIAHSPGMPDATPLMSFVTEAMRRNLNDPEALRNWTATASYWLVHQAPDGAAHNNLVIFLSSLLQEPWLVLQP